MSLHEVVYDTEGRIISAECVDDEISLANEKPEEVATEIDGHPVTTVFNKTPSLEEAKPLPTNPMSIFPFRYHTFKAISQDCVEEIDHVTGINDKGDMVSIQFSPKAVYFEDEINRANIRIGKRGFFWTEPGQQVDVYVAPAPKPGLKARLRAALDPTLYE